MGKKNKSRKRGSHTEGLKEHAAASMRTVDNKRIKTWLCIITGVFAFMLYAQTISFSYAYDDYTVIVENNIVKKGVKGIPELLRTDYWAGFSEGFVKEGQGLIYRPTSTVMFALEWELFPDNPKVSHFINVLLYAFTCIGVFFLLCYLFRRQSLFIPFACALLFAAHPIHTEVVSNIKSRDELLCFFFAVLSGLFFLKFYLNKRVVPLILGGLFFFLALLSKETAITFLACIPLMLFIADGFKLKTQLLAFLALTGCIAIYLLIRSQVNIGISTTGKIEYFTNVMAAAENSGDRFGTAIFILLRYIGLLILPHPLVSDYSYAQIELKHIGNSLVILSVLIHGAAGVYALLKIRKRSMVAFAILFYMITLAPVANIVFLIGSTMAERFLYIPSLGFCILVTLLLGRITNTLSNRGGYASLGNFFAKHSLMLWIVAGLLTLYSIKTYSRSSDWKNNLTLFSKDSRTSDKSSRMHYAYGSSLFASIDSTQQSLEEINNIYTITKSEMEAAIAIYPEYANAYISLGTIYKDRQDYKAAAVSLEKGRLYYPKPNSMLFKNMGYVYLKNGQYDKSIAALDSFLIMEPPTYEIYNNKGSALFGLKKYAEALTVFMKANNLNPNDIEVLKNIGRCYIYLKQYDKAEEYFKRVLAMEPNKSDNYQFLGLTYQLMNDSTRGNPLMRQYEAMKAAERK